MFLSYLVTSHNETTSLNKLLNKLVKSKKENHEIVLLDDETSDVHDTYFTPIYSEKISYDTWKRTINKSFQELSIR